MTRATQNSRGSALLIAIVFLLIVTAMASAFITLLHMNLTSATHDRAVQTGSNLAAAGVEKAAAILATNPAYTGEQNTPLGEGAFSVTVTPADRASAFHVSASARQSESPTICRVEADVEIVAAKPRIVSWKESP